MASDATRLLTRHFLRRLVDDDLVSPDADRHESLALACAALASFGLFASVLVSTKYLFDPHQTAGSTAVAAMSDRLLYIAASMTATALVTLLAWDGLAVDDRDTSVLGAMPIRVRTIAAAKFRALVTLAGLFSCALNVAPSVISPSLMVTRLPLPFHHLLALIVMHAVTVSLAAAFGFFVVLAIRGVLSAALGAAWFARISASVQAVLLVAVASAFLLLPVVSSSVGRAGFEPRSRAALMAPPLWFLGLQELAVGRLIADLPRGTPPPRVAETDARATARYHEAQALFPEMAATAAVKLAAFASAAVLLFAWNNRRMPTPVTARVGAGRLRRRFVRAARSVVRRPPAQATFFFTLQAMLRHPQHRLTLAASLAGGVTASVLALAAFGRERLFDGSAAPPGALAVQSLLVASLVVGFRHAVRIPAELSANWTMQTAWAGDTRPHIGGAKAAGVLLVIVVPVLALLPLHAALLGPARALAHALCGTLGGLVLLDALFLNYWRMPLACGYLPGGHLKALGPASVAAFCVLNYEFVRVERAALGSAAGVVTFAAVSAALLLALKLVDAHRRRHPHAIDFDELPEPPTQRLHLGG